MRRGIDSLDAVKTVEGKSKSARDVEQTDGCCGEEEEFRIHLSAGSNPKLLSLMNESRKLPD